MRPRRDLDAAKRLAVRRPRRVTLLVVCIHGREAGLCVCWTVSGGGVNISTGGGGSSSLHSSTGVGGVMFSILHTGSCSPNSDHGGRCTHSVSALLLVTLHVVTKLQVKMGNKVTFLACKMFLNFTCSQRVILSLVTLCRKIKLNCPRKLQRSNSGQMLHNKFKSISICGNTDT